MKVLFIQNVLFAYRVAFYNGLVDAGFDVTVMHSGKPTDQNTLFKELIVKQTNLGPFSFQSSRPDFNQFDTVVSMFDLHWPMNLLPALFSRNYRFLFWGHGLGRNQLGNKLRGWLVNRVDGIVVYSQKAEKKLKEVGVEAEKIFVANNTVEVENHGLDKKSVPNNFLFVGRLQERKRIDLILKSFKKMLELGDVPEDIGISIVGDGQPRAALESLAVELGISARCKFWGAITSNEELKPIFSTSIAYMSPGPMGLGINHALAFGVPMLSDNSQVHGPEAAILSDMNSVMINGVDDEQRIEQFAKAMFDMVSNPGKYHGFREQAYRDYIAFCSMDRMVEGFSGAINPAGTR